MHLHSSYYYQRKGAKASASLLGLVYSARNVIHHREDAISSRKKSNKYEGEKKKKAPRSSSPPSIPTTPLRPIPTTDGGAGNNGERH